MTKFIAGVTIPDRETHKMLSLFADAKAHSVFEIMKLIAVLTGKSDRYIWKKFSNRLLENRWIRRIYNSPFPHTDFYKLTPKGDSYFREVQISLIKRGESSDDAVRHYEHFDRTKKGKYGVEGMGKNITEKEAGIA